MTGEVKIDFTAKADGHDTPVPGNPAFNQVEVKRINGKQSEVQEMKDGVLVATVHLTLSNKNTELTIATTGSRHSDGVTVWTRTGGDKTPHDALAGEWMQDMSKTRLKQATVLKFDPDGGNGVQFTGGFSYSAHFDGKAYDLKGSRNDTVTLQANGPKTVVASYKRDGQETQKDVFTVSADGQQMTVKTTGTLETGQRLNEDLTFKKQ